MTASRSIILGALLLASLSAGFVRAEWRFDVETGAFYDSNLSKSDRPADVRDDWAWRSEIGAANGFQLTRDLRLNAGVNLRSEVWDRFGAFNTIGPGASASLRYRFGLGRLAPWILVEDRFGYDRVQDSAQSGYDNAVTLRSGIGLSERIALETSYTFESFVAPDNFYDRQIHHANARMVFDLTSTVQAAVGYTYHEGDVISYAVPPRPDIAGFAIEREDEDEFGSPLRTAYKLLGRTHAVSVSIAYQINKYASIQLGYEYAVTTHHPLRYENHLVEAKVAFEY